MKPINLSPAEVRGLLAGTVTLLLRPIQAVRGFPEHYICRPDMAAEPGTVWLYCAKTERVGCLVKCPFGVPGDQLYGREPWKFADWTEDGCPWIEYGDGGTTLKVNFPEEWADRLSDIWATLSDPANFDIDGRAADRKWRSAATMPAWASRITLTIESVRVLRVSEITEEEAIASGSRTPVAFLPKSCQRAAWTEREQFCRMWTDRYGKRYPWQTAWAWALKVRCA